MSSKWLGHVNAPRPAGPHAAGSPGGLYILPTLLPTPSPPGLRPVPNPVSYPVPTLFPTLSLSPTLIPPSPLKIDPLPRPSTSYTAHTHSRCP